MPLRILHVISELARGGAERQLVDVVSNTDRAACEHTVCYLQPPDDFAAEIREAGCGVIGLDLKGKHPLLQAAYRLNGLLRERRPDVISTWLYDADVSARLARLLAPRVPIVTSLQSPSYEPETIRAANWSPAKVKALRLLDRLTARWTGTFFVACSRFVERSAISQLGAPPSRVRMIYNSVDPTSLNCAPEDPPRLRESLGIPADAFVYVTVGRLDPPKGHAYLLRAFSEIAAAAPDAYLAVVGDGVLAQELPRLAAELGVGGRVKFLGKRKDLGACLGMADAFVFPTLFEGFGIALVEAMFKGLPSVGTRCTAVVEIIRDGENGLLVTPGSSEELAAAMRRLYDDPGLRERLGERGRRDAGARFLSRVIMPQWEDLYRRVASRRPLAETGAREVGGAEQAV